MVPAKIREMIPVSEPFLDDAESRLVNDALNKKAISGFFGEYIKKFEKGFADFCGCKYGVVVSNGTTALHLALVAIGIKRGDEVLVSTLTNMATEFAIIYQGAKPVPIDIEEDTLNLDPSLLESKITSKTKAIMVVHLFGHPVDMDPVIKVAKKYGLFVIEDCAEAHGALYKGRKVGSIGDFGCFSFYANKIITTGEGGMLTTNNEELADKARSLKSLAFGKTNKFMHEYVGYNYRMTNIQAAMGCAQLGKIEEVIKRKREIADFYNKSFKDIINVQLPVEKPYAKNVYWMYHVVLKGDLSDKRTEIMRKLAEKGIETREGFIPYNLQEIFLKEGLTKKEDCPKAKKIAYSSFYIPSGPLLTKEEREYVAKILKEIIL